ncbi:GNAT family N-acetyltransferase [Patescibacteria group bacterium]
MGSLRNEKIRIEGEIIYLKPLGEKNATKEYCGWLNDPGANQYLETKEATIAGLKKYIEEKNKNPNCLFLGIFFKENQKPHTSSTTSRTAWDRHIGNIKLEPIDFKNRKATAGILIGNKDYWGRGIGTEAMKLLVDYGFKYLNLKEINLGVLSQNKAAIRVYEGVGFKVKRIDKKSVHHSQKLYNTILMSIKNKKNNRQKK